MSTYDNIIIDAVNSRKFSISVDVLSADDRAYYISRGFKIYKNGILYNISWNINIVNNTNDNPISYIMTAQQLYLILTNNNVLNGLTPNVIEARIKKDSIVKDTFSVPDNTMISLYESTIDSLLSSGKSLFLTCGVLSLHTINIHSIELTYPVSAMVIDDGYDITVSIGDTSNDIDFVSYYLAARG